MLEHVTYDLVFGLLLMAPVPMQKFNVKSLLLGSMEVNILYAICILCSRVKICLYVAEKLE